jgi:hypothetical protein
MKISFEPRIRHDKAMRHPGLRPMAVSYHYLNGSLR